MLAALRFMAAQGLDLVITSGGLGPDRRRPDGRGRRRASRAARWCSTRRSRSGSRRSSSRWRKRWPNLDLEAIEAGNRKQATIPRGATVLEPVGTAPGLVVPPRRDGGAGPTVVVLPGPAARAAADVGAGASRPSRCSARCAGATELPPADAAAVRDTRVGDRRDAARRRARGRGARAAGDHDLPETRRDRGRDAL